MPISPTSRDVASAAGVSQSTVSYVLSGKRFVAPETRARVQRAMAELGYQPHASARALKSSRSRILGVVVPYHAYTDAPGQYRYIVSLAAACRRHDYELLVISGAEGVDGMTRLTRSALCDGLIVMDVLDEDPRTAVARESRIPSVFIGFSRDADSVIATDTDFEAMGARCIRLLHRAGHRRAVLLGPASEHIKPMGFSHRFASAVAQEAGAAGLDLTRVDVARSFHAMDAALSGVLAERDPADAFIAAPATSTDDVINVLLAHGEVPGRTVSVLGAGGSGDSPHSPIDCTHFDSDVDKVTSTAVDLLVAQLDGSLPLTGRAPERIPPRFHRGASVVEARP